MFPTSSKYLDTTIHMDPWCPAGVAGDDLDCWLLVQKLDIFDLVSCQDHVLWY